MMRKYLEKLPQEMQELIKLAGDTAARLDMRAYLVGGFVRDLILGVTNLDLDIVVEGEGIKFAEELSACLGSKLIRHRAFGTATIVSPNHLKIDVATARKEIYPRPGQLPEVSRGTIEDDLFRRDFTINALAADISPARFGKLIDLFGGVADLKSKKIRVMHEDSFIDDPTRILRAIRFEKRYGFNIEAKTLKYLKNAAGQGMLETVGPHRLRNELVLLLKEQQPIKPLVRMDELSAFGFIHKKLRLSKKRLSFLRSVKKQINWFRENFPHRRRLDAWLMYFTALIDGFGTGEVEKLCARFAFAKGEQKRMVDFKRLEAGLIRKLSARSIRPFGLFSLLEPLPYEVILLAKAKYRDPALKLHISEFFRIYNGTRIHVTGEDLQKLGLRPGPHYQRIFKKILRAKLEGRAVSRQEELSLVRRMAVIGRK